MGLTGMFYVEDPYLFGKPHNPNCNSMEQFPNTLKGAETDPKWMTKEALLN